MNENAQLGIGSGTIVSESSNTSTHSQSAHSQSSERFYPKNFKLPTISLPKFDGQYTMWLEFHDIFASLIHENESLTDVQRLHYLKASLEKEAADIIKSLPMSAANYTIAWKLICDRYTNKKLLIHNHLRALFQLKESQKESSSLLREMLDSVTRHLRSLEGLGLAIEHWDPVIIYLISSKFDKVTAREWEQQKFNSELPSLEELKSFLTQKADMLDKLGLHNSHDNKVLPKFVPKAQKVFSTFNISCYHCKEPHAIYNCPKFLKMSSHDRNATVKKLVLCANCLRKNHTADKCELRSRGCKKCKRNHNTLLHDDNTNISLESETGNSSQERAQVSLSSTLLVSSGNVVLATALILIKDIHGQFQKCRALLDSASQSNFITKELLERLGLNEFKVDISVQGINQLTSPITSQCSVNIQSRTTSFAARLNCLILHKISEELPNTIINAQLLQFPKHLELADPQFDTPGKVDLLIGAQLFWGLLAEGQLNFGKNMPVLQNTHLGWILSGPLQTPGCKTIKCFFTKNIESQFELQRFWELEEVPITRSWSQEQQETETHFQNNVKRDDIRRCIVSIPFKGCVDQLGNSHDTATKRFKYLEKRLDSNCNLKQSYQRFMSEYEQLGHMTRLETVDNSQPHYYLPHHGVINEASKTTKLRVVFDGSCMTTTGVSLNDLEAVGPPIQDLLFNILIRFRFHAIAFSADVKKMYRQVQIAQPDRRFQRILWRNDTSSPIHTYELNTVTYGTASAPYLAIRCLLYIADLNAQQFPKACGVIKSDFYVDDLLSGAETPEEAKIVCKQIVDILQSIQFPLHKWISNDHTILPSLNESTSTSGEVRIGSGEMTKTLGLYWTPESDQLNYKISNSSLEEENVTKRSLLSELSQVFDPLGLLSPSKIIGKAILQELWQKGIDWDDKLPQSIARKWHTFRSDLNTLNLLHIPRLVVCKEPIHLELHCFSDASEIAYATCIYVRSTAVNGMISVHLLCAKAKVSPLKQVTIPRLELCGAHLSAKLMTVVQNSLRRHIDKVFMWSDSTIVLGWLNTSPNALKVFVSHRVADIQQFPTYDVTN